MGKNTSVVNSCGGNELSDLQNAIIDNNMKCLYAIVQSNPDILLDAVYRLDQERLKSFLLYIIKALKNDIITKEEVVSLFTHKVYMNNEDTEGSDLFETLCFNAQDRVKGLSETRYLVVKIQLLIAFMNSIGHNTEDIGRNMYACMKKGSYIVGGVSSKRRKTKHNRKHKHKYRRSTKCSRRHKYNRSRN
jgi:hypothetical protein